MPRHRSWSDDDLRDALVGASTLSQVVERLRLSKGGASYTTVRTRLEQLGLDPPGAAHPSGARQPAWRRGFTEDELRWAVEEADSLKGVFDTLGLAVGGSQWATVRGLILERGWSTAHWRRPLGTRTPDPSFARFRRRLGRADLAALVAAARSRADVIRALGGTPTSSSYRLLRRALAVHELDTSHFEPAHQRIVEAPPRARRPLEQVLTRDSHVSTHQLRLRLLDEGVFEHRCTSCGLALWLDGPIPLQLDHIDGERTNNELANLRLLCPNCHALTDTYCGRNIGRR